MLLIKSYSGRLNPLQAVFTVQMRSFIGQAETDVLTLMSKTITNSPLQKYMYITIFHCINWLGSLIRTTNGSCIAFESRDYFMTKMATFM